MQLNMLYSYIKRKHVLCIFDNIINRFFSGQVNEDRTIFSSQSLTFWMACF